MQLLDLVVEVLDLVLEVLLLGLKGGYLAVSLICLVLKLFLEVVDRRLSGFGLLLLALLGHSL